MNRLSEGYVLADRFALGRRIAAGGMAEVWEAEDRVLSRTVAIKVIRPEYHDDPVFLARFRDEAVHAASLLHTNIATVFDFGAHDNLSFLVMERVHGRPLSQEIRERGPLAPARVCAIVAQAALALGVAHEAGVVHRDVKPANILVRDDELVKLTDFGIARALNSAGHTQLGELLGTPHYLSPEQASGQPATGASDLYALGVVAHEAVCGRRPFDAETPIAVALSHVHQQPPALPEHVEEPLAGVIEDLLAKDPADRPPNARAVAIRLGLHDHELMGLSLGLASAVNGDYPEPGIEEGPATGRARRMLQADIPTSAQEIAPG